ncbi:MAG: sel1 repeat family protein [Acidobacteria bacterium]|nr:sel1 repeat family protein [Acidobacteriota bacterium]
MHPARKTKAAPPDPPASGKTLPVTPSSEPTQALDPRATHIAQGEDLERIREATQSMPQGAPSRIDSAQPGDTQAPGTGATMPVEDVDPSKRVQVSLKELRRIVAEKTKEREESGATPPLVPGEQTQVLPVSAETTLRIPPGEDSPTSLMSVDSMVPEATLILRPGESTQAPGLPVEEGATTLMAVDSAVPERTLILRAEDFPSQDPSTGKVSVELAAAPEDSKPRDPAEDTEGTAKRPPERVQEALERMELGTALLPQVAPASGSGEGEETTTPIQKPLQGMGSTHPDATLIVRREELEQGGTVEPEPATTLMPLAHPDATLIVRREELEQGPKIEPAAVPEAAADPAPSTLLMPLAHPDATLIVRREELDTVAKTEPTAVPEAAADPAPATLLLPLAHPDATLIVRREELETAAKTEPLPEPESVAEPATTLMPLAHPDATMIVPREELEQGAKTEPLPEPEAVAEPATTLMALAHPDATLIVRREELEKGARIEPAAVPEAAADPAPATLLMPLAHPDATLIVRREELDAVAKTEPVPDPVPEAVAEPATTLLPLSHPDATVIVRREELDEGGTAKPLAEPEPGAVPEPPPSPSTGFLLVPGPVSPGESPAVPPPPQEPETQLLPKPQPAQPTLAMPRQEPAPATLLMPRVGPGVPASTMMLPVEELSALSEIPSPPVEGQPEAVSPYETQVMRTAPRPQPPPAPAAQAPPFVAPEAQPTSARGRPLFWVAGGVLVLLGVVGAVWAFRPGPLGGSASGPALPSLGESRARREIPPALKRYEEQARKGDAGAMRYLGTCFANGLMVPQDLAEARYWYRRAAEAGSMKAREELAQLEQSGK